MKVVVTQSCPTLWDPRNCSLPSSSVHVILQARILEWVAISLDFPGGSDSKASVYNAGDPGSIPGSGRSAGEGNGDPLQHFYFLKPLGSWLYIMPWEVVASVVQMVKNLPAMQETRVWSLGREDPLEKGMAIHSSILAWRIPWTEELGRLQFMGSQRVGHNWETNTTVYCR